MAFVASSIFAAHLSNNDAIVLAVNVQKLENLEFFMMNKKQEASPPENMQLLQLAEHQTLNQRQRARDISDVDDIMDKYDSTETKIKSNTDFITLLKNDDTILNYFIANYNPGANPNDDEKFLAYEFGKYSEMGWSEDGKPLDKQVLGHKKAKQFAADVLVKWKGFDIQNEPDEAQAMA